jgi:hypothetical protein
MRTAFLFLFNLAPAPRRERALAVVERAMPSLLQLF